MAKRLTEEMVMARTKISDLSKVKRLNCWGSDIVDVSLLRKMPSVEVLSLSINKINSLEDFGQCKRLEELFIRQNDIQDLNQVMYLQELINLKNLWLGENPCTKEEGYRNAVLRALPQLQKLDNIAVTADELREAQRKGKVLSHPDDPQESEEEVYVPDNQYKYEYQQEPVEYSPQRSPSRQEPSESETNEESEKLSNADEPSVEIPQVDVPPPEQINPPRRQPQLEVLRRNYSPDAEYIERRRSSYDPVSAPKPAQYYDRGPSNNYNEESIESHYKEPRLVTSQSTTNIKEYTNGDRYYGRNAYPRDDGSEIGYRTEGPIRSASQHNCSFAHKPPFQRRPVTRNSNILSAVLCLVKELDYPSLEVVEMAVRCRMDELDE